MYRCARHRTSYRKCDVVHYMQQQQQQQETTACRQRQYPSGAVQDLRYGSQQSGVAGGRLIQYANRGVGIINRALCLPGIGSGRPLLSCEARRPHGARRGQQGTRRKEGCGLRSGVFGYYRRCWFKHAGNQVGTSLGAESAGQRQAETDSRVPASRHLFSREKLSRTERQIMGFQLT